MIHHLTSFFIGRMLLARSMTIRILGLRILHHQWIRDSVIPAAFPIRRRLPFTSHDAP
jgi:hypothetical protein